MNIYTIRGYLEKQNMQCVYEGDMSRELVGFSSIYNYRENTLSWVRHAVTLEDESMTFDCRLACIITPVAARRIIEADAQIKAEDPRKVFFTIVDSFWGEEERVGISKLAHIEEGAVIGGNARIGAGTVVSSQAVIGDNCRIGANVTITGRVVVGNNCVIQSGAVIGEDGFAFIRESVGLTFVRHYGGVKIGNNVSIGSNTCVCRGTIDDTLIMDEAKIDNLCHIAHNAVIGERTLVIAGAVVMGSVRIGHDCWVSTSIIRDQRQVGNHCVIGMGAVVVNHLDDGVTVAGNPAKPFVRKEADHE